MFKKILLKFQVKATSTCDRDSARPVAAIPYLDLDGADREDDGFVLVGETKAERSSHASVEGHLDLPPSYESVVRKILFTM